ncbi:AMP-binding protein [Phenylobacterium montanum]|uniref:AMP-binding protein n=1 Tax=Phenylobacterium montanum TaxID=2823693 RepID=A0A975IUU5_9CAUL|nr:AMP-binding protein [Caulobacter sp. S6]QUD88322.1 AMP-binding protein [Caulobacter sp. S6]
MPDSHSQDPVDHVGVHARLQPDWLAAVDLTSGRRLTYAELDREAQACAGLLVGEWGCGPGDRVACLSKNRLEMIVLHLACARAGLIFAPLNWRLSRTELVDILADAEPRLVVGDDQLAEHGIEGAAFDDWWPDLAAREPRGLPRPDPDAASLILYTSGTSGRPKGVMLSARNLDETAQNFSLLGRVTPQSVFLVDSPMFHVIGLIASVRPAFLQGAAILVSDGFQPARTLSRLADPALGVTHYFCVPQMASRLRREPGFDPDALRRLTAVFTGGAPHPADEIRAWLTDRIPVVDGYGMSEAGTVFGMPPDVTQIARKAGSVGVPTPGVRVRIVGEDDQPVAPGEAGELQLQGRNLFQGYWRRPAETAAAFTADGWFRTGDIAVRDEDGFYRLVDRKKDMFISGGENVYPAEVEAILAGHPDLVEVAVIGHPDPSWGEIGVCFYVAVSGRSPEGEALRAHVAAALARYKVPKHFLALPNLPRNGAGKVLKPALRELAVQAGLSGPPRS